MNENPKIILLKGNGPISINNELMELYTITTAHGLIGLPLKSLRADNVYIVPKLEDYWDIDQRIRDKPACFVYSYDKLEDEDIKKITAQRLVKL